MNTSGSQKLRVEIGVETMARLLSGGQVCAADFYCLNKNSKQCLWRLCLECCTLAACEDNSNNTGKIPCPYCSGRTCHKAMGKTEIHPAQKKVDNKAGPWQ